MTTTSSIRSSVKQFWRHLTFGLIILAVFALSAHVAKAQGTISTTTSDDGSYQYQSGFGSWPANTSGYHVSGSEDASHGLETEGWCDNCSIGHCTINYTYVPQANEAPVSGVSYHISAYSKAMGSLSGVRGNPQTYGITTIGSNTTGVQTFPQPQGTGSVQSGSETSVLDADVTVTPNHSSNYTWTVTAYVDAETDCHIPVGQMDPKTGGELVGTLTYDDDANMVISNVTVNH